MVGVHETVGTLVVIAFVALLVVNLLRLRGAKFTWVRQLSFAASGLLLLQYVLGFGLLSGDGHQISGWHYIIALSALIPVGVEHGMANAREREHPGSGARVALLANAATAVLVIVAYSIGQNG